MDLEEKDFEKFLTRDFIFGYIIVNSESFCCKLIFFMITSEELSITFDLLLLLYTIFGMGYLINNYLITSIDGIAKKLEIRNEFLFGVILAVSNSIPEMTTNILSCFAKEKGMINYGFGTIVGSGVFGSTFFHSDFTICFGIACIFSENYHSEVKKFQIKPLLRDIYIYLFSLLYLVWICRDYKVTLLESLLLVSFYPIYLAYSFYSREEETKMRSFHPFDDEFRLEENEDEEISLTGRAIIPELPEKEKENFIMILVKGLVKAINFPWEFFYSLTIYPLKFPVISFTTIMVYTFAITQFTVNFVESIVSKLKISHAFIGLTLTSWGGNVSDIMNATVAAKHDRMELATSAIIGSQIINIHLCLGLPWLVKNLTEGEVVFKEQSLFYSIFIVFFITSLSVLTMKMNEYKLNRKLGVQLLAIYLVYFIYEFKENVK